MMFAQGWSIAWSVAVLGFLAIASILFNGYIDGRDEGDGFDGETSVWVALGTTYTVVIGIGGLAAVWGGWLMGLYAILISFAAFFASGLPMMFGDANRTRRRRVKMR